MLYDVLVAAGWTQSVTAIATAVGALGLGAAAAGVFFASRSLRENALSRHAQIALDLGKRWDDDPLASVRQLLVKSDVFDADSLYEFVKNQADLNSNDYWKLERFANFFEGLAVLWRLEILSIEWIDQTLGESVMGYWQMWTVQAASERSTYPRAYENWRDLAAALGSLPRETSDGGTWG
jgi:hypothetical protein